ncbi:pyruvate kinase [Halobacteriovorax sp. HLS]|uniref:pyruvate kinase n=1 Tax=Halobacteriovorax sp. HLS TaxID=2234000 RepID=UPI000FDC673F|nr:pyruvate kinase [Halobacteriovorax sp. HLS]
MRRAKIIATLGPSSNTIDQIQKLIETGMNVCRVNMSHGTHESHKELIANIRKASALAKKEVAILADLQGPKIRVDKLATNLELKDDSVWVIGPSSVQDKYPEYKDCYIPTIYEKLVDDCFDGARILFDDGLMIAEAIERDREVYKIKVSVGGILKSNKGINLPDCDVSAPSFTEKDKADLMFALTQNIDYIALSFVRKREDIQQVKTLLHDLKINIPIISKIEKPQAIDNIEGILDVTDVIMVARGDMGVEVGNHLVPSIQKKLIKLCNERGIPVITATQMLESMTHNPTPTRAEASDVANAIWDGTDAVMLSGETASGSYPVEAVRTMVQIILDAEQSPKERPLLRHVDLSSVHASVMVAASLIGEKVFAKRILAVTDTGTSCLKLAKFRPDTPCLGVTSKEATARRMCLYWGIEPFLLKGYSEDSFNFQEHVIEEVKNLLGLVNGDKLVITRGDGKFFSAGSSNSVKVEIIKDTPKVLGSDEALEEASDDKKKILLDHNICATCQRCVEICPHGIWVVDKVTKDTNLNADQISHCKMDMECVEACPTGAIEIISSFT